MRTSNSSFTPVHCLVRQMTKKAVLVTLTEDKREAWVPMSVIDEDDLAELDVGVVTEINIAEWFYDRELA